MRKTTRAPKTNEIMSKKPRLLFIGALPPPYIGPSIAAMDILNSKLLNTAYDIHFCNISDKRDLTSLGKFEWINAGLALLHILKCLTLMLWKWPDLVYLGVSQGLWGYLRDLGFLVPAVALRRRVVVHLRGSEFDIFYRAMPPILGALTRLLFKRIACVIVLSESFRQVFQELVSADRIRVVPNGIDPTLFGEQQQIFRKAKEQKRVLWLSNLFARKGIVQFINALPAVLDAHPETITTIAGEWESVELKSKMMQYIKEHDLTGKIIFAGRVGPDEKRRLYSTHDVFVLPPIEPEGMPWAILEAMSAGLPVIATAQGAIPDLVIDGKTGIIVDPAPESISQALNSVLNNPDMRKDMGYQGRNLIEQKFSKDAYLSRLCHAFAFAKASQFPPVRTLNSKTGLKCQGTSRGI